MYWLQIGQGVPQLKSAQSLHSSDTASPAPGVRAANLAVSSVCQKTLGPRVRELAPNVETTDSTDSKGGFFCSTDLAAA